MVENGAERSRGVEPGQGRPAPSAVWSAGDL